MTITDTPTALPDVPADVPPVVLPTVRIPITLTCVAPLHHGAGTAGNTALLRTQEIVLPDGTQTAVPFVSGNSLRHAIRDALAWRLARVLDLPAGSLPKGVVDLLWSGGALTKTGSQVELQQIRDLALVPALGLLGYSAQSDIVTGVLRVDNANLVCAENAWRLPTHLAQHPHAALPAGRFRGEEFGTRHDVAGTPVDALVADSGMWADGVAAAAPATTQMIYEHQVLLPGATLWSHLQLDAAPPLAVTALHTALLDLAPGGTMWVAARRASGWSACRLDLHQGATLDPDAPVRHDAHVLEHRARVLDAIRAAAA